MIELQELESQKYYRPTKCRDKKLVRKIKRQQALGQFFSLCFFSAAATFAVLWCTGQLSDIDIVGSIERIGLYWRT